MKSLTMALAAGTLAIGAAPAAAVELAPLAIAQPAPASPTLAAFGDDDDRRYRRGRGHRVYDDRGRYYEPRRISRRDRMWRGNDGRYYCKRDDGTTGTIVGALAGGVLGNVIAPGGSKTLGTILGGGAGALAGRAIDRNDISCE